VEVVSGPLAALLERLARNAEPLVPSAASSAGVPRSNAHGGHGGGQAVDGAGQPATVPPPPADGRPVGDRVDLSQGDQPALVLYGPPSADRARSLPEPGLAAERLHQLVQRLHEMEQAAVRDGPGRPAGPGPAPPGGATVPTAAVPDASTLALAGAFAAPAPQLAGLAVAGAGRVRRRPEEEPEGDPADDPADDGTGADSAHDDGNHAEADAGREARADAGAGPGRAAPRG
jgi:hypothetical protein